MCHQMLRGEYNIYYVLSPLSQPIGMCGKHCSLVWEYYMLSCNIIILWKVFFVCYQNRAMGIAMVGSFLYIIVMRYFLCVVLVKASLQLKLLLILL